jgi:hypothetical protein
MLPLGSKRNIQANVVTHLEVHSAKIMVLNKLYLDQPHFYNLNCIGIEEGFITETEAGNKLLPKDVIIPNKESLLLNLTLFDSVDSWSSYYNLNSLVDNGLIKGSAKMFDYYTMFETRLDFELDNELNKIDFEKKLYAHELSKQVLKKNLNLLLDHLINDRHNMGKELLNSKINKKYVSDFVFSLLSLENKSNLHKDFEEYIWIDQRKSNLPFEDRTNDFNWKFYLKQQLIHYLKTLTHAIYYSIKDNHSYLTIFQEEQHKKSSDINSNSEYIVRTKLEENSLIFPYPESLTDVLKIRERKELIRFRKVLSEWLIALQSGDEYVERKMRIDILKANKELKNLDKWKEYKSSPINFWMNTIGGHIPIFSNVLTIIGTLGHLYEKRTENRFNWLQLVNG